MHSKQLLQNDTHVLNRATHTKTEQCKESGIGQLLMKDRLLEDWAISGDTKEEISTETRIKNTESRLNKAQTSQSENEAGRDGNEAQTRLARLIAGFRSIKHQLVQRLERLEELTGCHPAAVDDDLLPDSMSQSGLD